MWLATYGGLYQRLCSTTGDIPIGMLRTEEVAKVPNTGVKHRIFPKAFPLFPLSSRSNCRNTIFLIFLKFRTFLSTGVLLKRLKQKLRNGFTKLYILF